MPTTRKWIYIALISIFQIHFCLADSNRNHLGFGFDTGHSTVTIPFTSYSNLIIIESQIDEKTKLNLILDTGVRSLVLFDRSFLPEISDHTFNIQFTGAGTYEPIDALVSVDHNLRLCEGVVANQINAVILKQSNRSLHNLKGIKIHGAFGYQLFARFQVRIDYRNNLITLTEPEKVRFIHGFKAIPISIHDTKPFVEMDFLVKKNKWSRKNLIVDLGANHQILLYRIDGIKNAPTHPYHNTKIADGLNGAIYGEKAISAATMLGEVSYRNKEVLVPSKKTYSQEDFSGFKKHGSIGGNFFDDSVIILDYVNGYLFIESKDDEQIEHGYITQMENRE